MSHTKGPWKFIDVVGCCEIYATDRQLLKYMSPTKTNIANARLMAASPDLLEALEDLKREIILSDVDMAYIDSHFKKWLEKAASAIAKAKGTIS